MILYTYRMPYEKSPSNVMKSIPSVATPLETPAGRVVVQDGWLALPCSSATCTMYSSLSTDKVPETSTSTHTYGRRTDRPTPEKYLRGDSVMKYLFTSLCSTDFHGVMNFRGTPGIHKAKDCRNMDKKKNRVAVRVRTYLTSPSACSDVRKMRELL